MRLLSRFTSPVTATIVVYPGVVVFYIAKLMPVMAQRELFFLKK
jgi:hypothetical protein